MEIGRQTSNMLKKFTEAVQSMFTLKTATNLASALASSSSIGVNVNASYLRSRAIEKSREMYFTDSRIYSAIETLTRDVTYGNFNIVVTRGTDQSTAQNIIDGLVSRLKLNLLVDDWFRSVLIDGEGFIELSIDNDLVVGAKKKEVLSAYRLTDIEDNFFDFDVAYVRTAQLLSYNDISNTMPSIPSQSITYPVENVVYPRLPRTGNQRNGRPLFYSAFNAWDKLCEGEVNLSIQRRLRSGYLRHHIISGANQETLHAYRSATKDNLDNPYTPVCDLFTSDSIEVKILKGSIDADQISDVLHHLETVFAASPVPLALIGYGASINRDIVEQKLEQYNRSLVAWTEFVDRELINPIIERQLSLAGLYVDSYEWDVIRPSRSKTKVSELGVLTKALNELKQVGIHSDDDLMRIFNHYCNI